MKKVIKALTLFLSLVILIGVCFAGCGGNFNKTPLETENLVDKPDSILTVDNKKIDDSAKIEKIYSEYNKLFDSLKNVSTIKSYFSQTTLREKMSQNEYIKFLYNQRRTLTKKPEFNAEYVWSGFKFENVSYDSYILIKDNDCLWVVPVYNNVSVGIDDHFLTLFFERDAIDAFWQYVKDNV